MSPSKPKDGPARLACLLDRQRIDAVLDVGANQGQYGRFLREAGYAGPILSFEPLAEPRLALAQAAGDDPLWRLAPPLALGDCAGEAVIEVSAESDMSSLLPQASMLQAVSPSSAVLERRRVTTARLDAQGDLIDPAWRRLHLKIDVQGFEPRVLDGARGLMDRIATLQLELALEPVYVGETGWRAMVDRLAEAGFRLALVLPGYFERKLGRMLQFDGVFIRHEAGDPVAGDLPN